MACTCVHICVYMCVVCMRVCDCVRTCLYLCVLYALHMCLCVLDFTPLIVFFGTILSIKLSHYDSDHVK